jgi:hypothetical protein
MQVSRQLPGVQVAQVEQCVCTPNTIAELQEEVAEKEEETSVHVVLRDSYVGHKVSMQLAMKWIRLVMLRPFALLEKSPFVCQRGSIVSRT